MQSFSLFTSSIAATATIVGNRFIDAGGTQSAATSHPIGVARSAATSGQQVPVDMIGSTQLVVGGAVAAGQELVADANGKAIAYTGTRYRTAHIAGGAAGALTVTGITTADRLVAVLVLDRDATAANVNLDDLTAEFTVTAANTISNAAGTATTGDALYVIWEVAGPRPRARALSAATGADQEIEALLI